MPVGFVAVDEDLHGGDVEDFQVGVLFHQELDELAALLRWRKEGGHVQEVETHRMVAVFLRTEPYVVGTVLKHIVADVFFGAPDFCFEGTVFAIVGATLDSVVLNLALGLLVEGMHDGLQARVEIGPEDGQA